MRRPVSAQTGQRKSSPSGCPWPFLSPALASAVVLGWLNIAYVPLGILGVILTASRSGFIATCIGLLSVFFALRHARPLYRLAWSAVMLAVFAGLFFAVPVGEDLEANIQRITLSADTRSLETLTGRTTIWSRGLEMFEEHPIAGMGASTFMLGLEARGGGHLAPHNIWVEVAV